MSIRISNRNNKRKNRLENIKRETSLFDDRKRNSVSAFLLALLLFAMLLGSAATLAGCNIKDANKGEMPEGLTKAEVVWVTDGDTIICEINESDLPEDVLLANSNYSGNEVSEDKVAVDEDNGQDEDLEYENNEEEFGQENADGIVRLRIRFIGVDAPESVHPDPEKNSEEGEAASEYTKEMLLDKTVYLEFDVEITDKYGRTLAYVWLDGELFNKKIIEDGHAVIMTVPPNVKYEDILEEAYKEYGAQMFS